MSRASLDNQALTSIRHATESRKAKTYIDALVFALQQIKNNPNPAVTTVLQTFINKRITEIQQTIRSSVEYRHSTTTVAAILSVISNQIEIKISHAANHFKHHWQQLNEQIKHLSKSSPKHWDKLIALQTRQVNCDNYVAKYRDGDETKSTILIEHIKHCLDNKLGLFRYVNTADNAPDSEAWFTSLPKVEQIYFSNLITQLNTIVSGLSPDNTQRDQVFKDNLGLFTQAIYPFPSGYTSTPVIANAEVQYFHFNDNGNIDRVESDDLLAIGNYCDNQDPLATFKFARVGLPDQGKKGSSADKQAFVDDIVSQLTYIHQKDNKQRHDAVTKYWDVSIPECHFTVSLIDDKRDLLGLGPADTKYQQAIARQFEGEGTPEHTFQRFAINATREFMSTKTVVTEARKQRDFITKARSVRNSILSQNAAIFKTPAKSVEEIKRKAQYFHMLTDAIEAYEHIQQRIEDHYSSTAREIKDTDRDNLQLRLAEMQLIICHLLGWSFEANCKSSKDRTGLLAACTAAEIAHHLSTSSFSSSITSIANSIQTDHNKSTYQSNFCRAYAPQLTLAARMAPGAIGLKNRENIDQDFHPVIRLAASIPMALMKAIKSSIDFARQSALGAIMFPLVVAGKFLAGLVKGLTRLGKRGAYTQTPLREQMAIDADPEDKIKQAITKATGYAAEKLEKPTFNSLTKAAKLNKTSKKLKANDKQIRAQKPIINQTMHSFDHKAHLTTTTDNATKIQAFYREHAARKNTGKKSPSVTSTGQPPPQRQATSDDRIASLRKQGMFRQQSCSAVPRQSTSKFQSQEGVNLNLYTGITVA